MKDNKEKDCPLNKKAVKIIKKENKKIINKPLHLIKKEVDTIDSIEQMMKDRARRVEKEILMGFKAIRSYPKSVTIFGSARLKKNHPFYQKAKELGAAICKEGYAVITGGGPGIMQAANEGTFTECGFGVGFNIELPFEQSINPFVTHGVDFHYFFTRKVSMTFSGEAYIYFPGGFGTLDEMFEILTLVQTKKMPKVPIILFGKKYWNPLVNFFKNTLLSDDFGTISKKDLDLFVVTDDIQEVVNIVKKAKIRNEYSNVKK